eukprot:scaffold25703_cov45-Phaeocystis_antarctica.AAC.2
MPSGSPRASRSASRSLVRVRVRVRVGVRVRVRVGVRVRVRAWRGARGAREVARVRIRVGVGVRVRVGVRVTSTRSLPPACARYLAAPTASCGRSGSVDRRRGPVRELVSSSASSREPGVLVRGGPCASTWRPYVVLWARAGGATAVPRAVKSPEADQASRGRPPWSYGRNCHRQANTHRGGGEGGAEGGGGNGGGEGGGQSGSAGVRLAGCGLGGERCSARLPCGAFRQCRKSRSP